MMKIGGIDAKDLRVGVGGSAVTPSRVMVGTGSEAVKIWPLVEVHEVSVSGTGTRPLVTVTVPAGETWTVRVQGTVTQAAGWSSGQPTVRIGSRTSGRYSQGAAVDFSGTITSSNATIALAGSTFTFAFVGTVTIEK